MSILGNIGSMYMIILILILIGGLGMAGIGFYNFLFNRKKRISSKNDLIQENGGYVMQNNGWLKLALFSFVGIILAFGALSLLTPNTMNPNSMAGNNTMQSTNGMNMMGATNDSNMNGTPMGATQMQNTTNGSNSNNASAIMYQLNQMQMQINQIQQQLMNNTNATTQSMPQGNTNNMGGMGMMPMGGMPASGSSMPASGSSMPASGSSMPSSGSSSMPAPSSGGSMGMM